MGRNNVYSAVVHFKGEKLGYDFVIQNPVTEELWLEEGVEGVVRKHVEMCAIDPNLEPVLGFPRIPTSVTTLSSGRRFVVEMNPIDSWEAEDLRADLVDALYGI